MNNFTVMYSLLGGKLRRLFFMSYPETNRDYKKSRICYTTASAAISPVGDLTQGAYLVALMTYLGFSDGDMGVVNAIASLAGVMQLVSMKLSKRIVKNKLFVCIGEFQRFWLAFMFFIPLFALSGENGRILMAGCYLWAKVSETLISPALTDWVARLVPERFRGRYFSIKEAVGTFTNVTTTLIVGILLDALSHRKLLMFTVVGSIVVVLVAVNVMSMLLMKEAKAEHVNAEGREMMGRLARKDAAAPSAQSVRFTQELRIAFADKNFRQLLWFNLLYTVAIYVANPFNGSFKVNDLGLSYTFLSVCTFGACMVRVYLLPKVGKLADRIGMTRVTTWSFLGLAVNYLFSAFSTPANAVPMHMVSAMGNAAVWGFIGTGMLGIKLKCLKEERRIPQLALLAVIPGLFGFLLTVVMGKFVDWLQVYIADGNTIFTYAQQFTNILGVAAVGITIIYMRKTFKGM